MRDLIIGIKVVLADGTVAKAGGKVVKNVAGYDLSKLFTGSLGTLGVIAEANFRLHPIRESARTVFLEVDDHEQIPDVAQALTHSTSASSCSTPWRCAGRDDRGVIAALFEGIEPAVEAQAARRPSSCAPTARRTSSARTTATSSGSSFARRPWATGDVALKIGAPPADLTAVLDSVLGAAERAGVEARALGPRRDRGDLRGALRRGRRRSSRSSRRCARSGSAGAGASSCRRLLSRSRRGWTCGARGGLPRPHAAGKGEVRSGVHHEPR